MQKIDFLNSKSIKKILLIEVVVSITMLLVTFLPKAIFWTLIFLWPTMLTCLAIVLVLICCKKTEWDLTFLGLGIKQSQFILWIIPIVFLPPYIYFLFNFIFFPDSSTYGLIFVFYPIETVIVVVLIWFILFVFNFLKKIFIKNKK